MGAWIGSTLGMVLAEAFVVFGLLLIAEGAGWLQGGAAPTSRSQSLM